MPSAKILEEKKRIVNDLTEKLRSPAGVLVDYKGITVNEDTELRAKLREAQIDYSVVKNTMMRYAVKNVGLDGLEPILVGSTSLAVSSDDPLAPARVIKESADGFADYFEIKGGFMDGRVLSLSEVFTLASIPPLPILQAQLLGTMLAPIASLAVVLKAITEQKEGPAPTEIISEDSAAEDNAEDKASGQAQAEPEAETAATEAAEQAEATSADSAPTEETQAEPAAEAAEPAAEAEAEPAAEAAEPAAEAAADEPTAE